MTAEEKVDRRILKTKKAIRQAVVSLLGQQELATITVTEIAARAEVNRKTFYNYYENIYQVLDEIENEIVRAFEGVIATFSLKKEGLNPLPLFESWATVMQGEFKFYSQLLQSNKVELQSLLTKISQMLKDKLKGSVPKDLFEDDMTLDVTVNFTIAGMMEVFQSWVKNPQRVSLVELSQTMSRLTFSGINSLLKGSEHE